MAPKRKDYVDQSDASGAGSLGSGDDLTTAYNAMQEIIQDIRGSTINKAAIGATDYLLSIGHPTGSKMNRGGLEYCAIKTGADVIGAMVIKLDDKSELKRKFSELQKKYGAFMNALSLEGDEVDLQSAMGVDSSPRDITEAMGSRIG